MLTERTLITVALVTSLLGIAALYFVLQYTSLPVSQLSTIVLDEVGEEVRIHAVVVDSRVVGNGTVTLLTLSAIEERKAVIFSPVKLVVGTKVEVIGTIDEYNGEAELIISSLEVIS